jgi:glutathione synthase
MAKSLQVAVQMDALESINVAGDSSLALMLEAQSRGARIFHYLPDQLDWVEEKVVATARPVELMWPPAPGEAHFRWLGEPRQVDLAAEIDVVLLRQDPPFDMAYITSTHLLERARDAGVLVVNDPTSVRNAPEKLFVRSIAKWW